MRRTFALAALLALSLAPASARAQSDLARAKEAYDRGVGAHGRGDFHAAARAFAEADALAPSAVALQAALDEAVDADDPVVGAELLERSQRVAAPVPARLARSIDAARKKLGGRAGRVHVTCPAGATCTATMDDASFDTKKAAWTALGPHKLVVVVDGETLLKTIDVKASDTVEIAPLARSAAPAVAPAPAPAGPLPPTAPPTPSEPPAAAPEAPRAAPPPTEARSGLSPVVFWVGLGVTAAAGATAGYFMLHTKSLHDDFASAGCSNAAASGCDTKKSDGESAQTTANITLGVTAGLAVLVTLVGVAFTDWKPSQGSSALRGLAPSASRDGGGATYSLRF
jgi:hypothetical protein